MLALYDCSPTDFLNFWERPVGTPSIGDCQI